MSSIAIQEVNLVGSLYMPEVVIDGQSLAYILVDDHGNETTAVASDDEIILDATPNDIRIGKTAATGEGVTVGEKEIPAYHTTEGWRAIPNGGEFKIILSDGDRYDFTKLQAILCPYSMSMAKSVAADKVVIDKGVYQVQSTEELASVSVIHENKTINLGITNTSGKPFVIRYFTYKEEI